jgi:non-heme chloroperoxidase
MLSSKIVRDATLKMYPGAPHGMCTTLADQINGDLLAFLHQSAGSGAGTARGSHN